MNLLEYFEYLSNRYKHVKIRLWAAFCITGLLSFSLVISGIDGNAKKELLVGFSFLVTFHLLFAIWFFIFFRDRMSKETIYRATTIAANIWEWYKAIAYILFFILLVVIEVILVYGYYKV